MKLLAVLLLAVAGASIADDGPTKADNYRSDAYAVCSACHIAGGEGVPGAFPPLKNRAAEIASLEGGRQYLISVVSTGLMGMLKVDGMTYMGVMPGHQSSMSPQQIADALNYVIFSLVDDIDEEFEPFTKAEVIAQQETVGSPSPAVAAEMRSKLLERHAGEWPH